jgi:hypothetical protein
MATDKDALLEMLTKAKIKFFTSSSKDGELERVHIDYGYTSSFIEFEFDGAGQLRDVSTT